jgi:uncharacterized protein
MWSRRGKGKGGMIGATVAGLFVYPVKGCAGTALASARLLERGLEHDRRWMVARAGDGRFVTQREVPGLARVRPSVLADRLALRLPDGTEIAVPLDDSGEPLAVRVWGDEVAAVAPSARADAALSACLGRRLRLVRFPEARRRDCDPDFAPPGSHTGFADGFPLLVTTESSLAELNDALLERGEAPVPMDRFRPNVVLSGPPARAEDRARSVRLEGGPELLLVKPCDRCVVTTTDQATGERTGPEPVATLGRIRRNARTGGVMFGQNAVPALPAGGEARLAVGQACELVPAG